MVQQHFLELDNRHIDFLKRDIIKGMNKATALDELIRGPSEYIDRCLEDCYVPEADVLSLHQLCSRLYLHVGHHLKTKI